MKNVFIQLLTGILFLGIIISCQPDEDENEQELITTIIYTLIPEDGGTSVTMTFMDLDGDGGGVPEISTSGALKSGKSYRGKLVLRNDAAMPPVDITTEIKEEADAHQFFFQPLGGVAGKVAVTYADIDSKGKPVGLETDLVVTTGPGAGKLKIILRHHPNKSGTGVSTGDISNAGGDTDLEVEFEVVIE